MPTACEPWPGNTNAVCARRMGRLSDCVDLLIVELVRVGRLRLSSSRPINKSTNHSIPTPVSGDGDRGVEIDVLNDVQDLDPLFHRPLERFASGDQPGAAGALVD